MSPLYDFICSNGHTTEQRAGIDVKSIPCPSCQEEASRVPFYRDCCIITETGMGSGYGLPRSNEAYTRNGNYAVSRFQEASQELDYKHRQAEERAQQKLPAKSYYKEGLKRAEALGAKRNAKFVAPA